MMDERTVEAERDLFEVVVRMWAKPGLVAALSSMAGRC